MDSRPPPPLYITEHAHLRWAERVEPGLTPPEARASIRRFLEGASFSRKPRGWMKSTKTFPAGGRFAFNVNEWPKVALVVIEGSVASVVTAEMNSGPWPIVERHGMRRTEQRLRKRLKAEERR
ncbi:MAG: hypothetical protein M3067_05930 [Chloroflexota bacterium]|nr:hypothetical protein [Chloroflexota bacterium]MDQ6898247.1 hypothetical protein [Candidatus Dormibacteraeota bacterium]